MGTYLLYLVTASIAVLLQSVEATGAITGTIASTYCDKLHQKYKPGNNTLFIYGCPRKLIIRSTARLPSRASAALLAAGLRHRHGYQVHIEIDNRTNCRIAEEVPSLMYRNGTEYDEILIYIDADTEGPYEDCPVLRKKCNNQMMTCNVAGTRLENIGYAAAVNVLWHVRLAEHVQNKSACAETKFWYFYQNPNSLDECGFSTQSNETNRGTLLVSSEFDENGKLDKIVESFKYLDRQIVNRTQLTDMIDNYKNSFLFIDYDLWSEQHSVKIIEDSPRVAKYDPRVSLRLADVDVFQDYAPLILKTISTFNAQADHLRQILEINEEMTSLEEAACSWAQSHSDKFEFLIGNESFEWIILAFVCNQTKASDRYIEMLANGIRPWVINRYNNTFSFRQQTIDCSLQNDVNFFSDKFSKYGNYRKIVGYLAPGIGATVAAREKANSSETPIIFYDVTTTSVPLAAAATSSTGRLQQLAIAITKFFKQQDWHRIAVISDTTLISKDLFQELKDGDVSFVYQELRLTKVNLSSVRNALAELKNYNARIVFLNADSYTNNLIACEAANMGLTPDEGYAWVARDWHWTRDCLDSVEPVPMFTVSFWWRGGDLSAVRDVTEGANEELQTALNSYWGNETWSPLAAPFADAVVMMTSAVTTMLQKHPERRFDFHSVGTSRLIAEELTRNRSLGGLTQRLQQDRDNFTLNEPLIYVTLWKKSSHELLAVWKAIGDYVKELKVLRMPFQNSHPPHDGRSSCLAKLPGDKFNPYCLDYVWILTCITIVVVLIFLWHLIRKHERLMKEREKQLLDRLRKLLPVSNTDERLMRVVDRSAIKFCETLGSGFFGLVYSGVIQEPDRMVEDVAIKALKKDPNRAEEEEFLREASALASLSHQHIVRLVGVCTGDGPPLLLMEYAFFGDLLHYLRARYNLVFAEHKQILDWDNAEARHVSARELTRLAREAASALVYLEKRRLLHRDVRASNCLIDATRTLKLADFGLARWLNKSEHPTWPEVSESGYKYILHHPTVFPVRWTPPESLNDGVFSYASDVWSLGVLILEIVTLGAPPYGTWHDNKVLYYVKNGGRPPLPRDVTMQTCTVTSMCWHLQPEMRATANNVRNYLSRYPEALRPAYKEPDCTMTSGTEADSGFGEREVDPDWPLPKDPCISTF